MIQINPETVQTKLVTNLILLIDQLISNLLNLKILGIYGQRFRNLIIQLWKNCTFSSRKWKKISRRTKTLKWFHQFRSIYIQIFFEINFFFQITKQLECTTSDLKKDEYQVGKIKEVFNGEPLFLSDDEETEEKEDEQEEYHTNGTSNLHPSKKRKLISL